MKLASKWLRATPALAIASLMATPAFADTCEDVTAQINKGDTTWMLISSALVLMMSIPALALFYGGLVRTKNMLSVLSQVFMIVSLVAVIWVVYGYSLSFTDGGSANAFIGGFSKAFLSGVLPTCGAATFTDGVFIPEQAFVVFQMTFACITPALIIGSFAERFKFSALVLFIILWVTFIYFPVAHMVWSAGGLAFDWGTLDFAGGTVVHINAGIAGMVGCLMIGKRAGYGKEIMAPHSLTMTLIGASLLWVGWFGFNAGSNLEANGVTALAFLNTFVAPAAAALSWLFAEWAVKGKPSLLGMVSGAVAGLVAVTPAAGFAGPMGSVVLGLVTGVVCFFFCSKVKNAFGYDDSLDVFGVHCIGGIVGAIGTGILVSPDLGGVGLDGYSMGGQVWTQFKAVILTLVWSGVGSAILYKIVDLIIGLRVTPEQELEGLDISTHGERAYHS